MRAMFYPLPAFALIAPLLRFSYLSAPYHHFTPPRIPAAMIVSDNLPLHTDFPSATNQTQHKIMNNTLHNRLRHHVTGAIERGEAQAIVEIPALHKGPFPLHTTKNDDAFVIITNHGTHYAKTFDPSAARLISAAPDLLSALDLILNKINAHGLENKHMIAAIEKAELAIAKAKGEI